MKSFRLRARTVDRLQAIVRAARLKGFEPIRNRTDAIHVAIGLLYKTLCEVENVDKEEQKKES